MKKIKSIFISVLLSFGFMITAFADELPPEPDGAANGISQIFGSSTVVISILFVIAAVITAFVVIRLVKLKKRNINSKKKEEDVL